MVDDTSSPQVIPGNPNRDNIIFLRSIDLHNAQAGTLPTESIRRGSVPELYPKLAVVLALGTGAAIRTPHPEKPTLEISENGSINEVR